MGKLYFSKRTGLHVLNGQAYLHPAQNKNKTLSANIRRCDNTCYAQAASFRIYEQNKNVAQTRPLTTDS